MKRVQKRFQVGKETRKRIDPSEGKYVDFEEIE
jgi:hypothetical protein